VREPVKHQERIGEQIESGADAPSTFAEQLNDRFAVYRV
jgi:hypothetical protein